MANAAAGKRMYLIPILSKTLDVLEMLEEQKRPLTLEQIHQQTGISKTTVFRILRTLVHRGYVSRPEDGRYRLVSRPKKLRFGFGGQSGQLPFSIAVTESLKAAAVAAGIDLLVMDNQYDGEVARKNVERFVEERVDLVLEFQTDRLVAPIIANKLAEAGIPLIAVDSPHPNAVYFGVDNYRAGLDGGDFLGSVAMDRYKGRVDFVVGLDLVRAGSLVQSRITGAFEGIRERIVDIPAEKFVRLDSCGLREESHKVMRAFLRKNRAERRILVAAINDTAALGAIDAARELNREQQLCVVSHDCIDEALEEMRRKNSPLVASVSHEVAKYGPSLIQLGLSLLKGESVAPYNYVEHRVVKSPAVAHRTSR
jgi:ribose transport system substrate-binding protein